MTTPASPFSKGLFVKLSGIDDAARDPAIVPVKLGAEYYDAHPYFEAYNRAGHLVKEFARNPYDHRPLQHMEQLVHHIAPHMQPNRHHPAVREHMHHMHHGLANFMKHSQYLVRMRLKTAHHLARAPKILIPMGVSIPSGSTFSAIQVRNPYLGATGGQDGSYLYPWTITSFRTSNNESGQLQPIRLTQFLIGGHDFVQASLSGVTYAGTAAPATLGWPAAAFTETARKNWQSVVQPWNVVSLYGEGTGFGSIMTETGFLQIGVFNGGGSTYNDTYSVYANATLCGSPFGNAQWTQTDMFRHSFAPLALQGPMAMRLAHSAMEHIRGAIDKDDPRYNLAGTGLEWAVRTESTMNELNRFIDNPPAGLAMGDPVDAPSGMNLSGGASWIQD